MQFRGGFLCALAIFAGCLSGQARETAPNGWERLASLPDREGFAAPFAGVSHGTLLVAGGANFPGKRPWEGGKKAWYDTVFALEQPAGEWKVAGKLPRPLGYGVSATYGDELVCVGGSDAERHYADAFRLEWRKGRIITHPLPPLPRPVANACGALVGRTLYVAGGQERPDSTEALKLVYRLDLSRPNAAWETVDPWPGPGRMLATAASMDGEFCVVGGVDLVRTGETATRRYLRDGYAFRPGNGWRRLPDLPVPVAAAPSPAPIERGGFLLLGGDDGSKVGFMPPDDHPGFRSRIMRYERHTERWTDAGSVPAPRVTVPVVRWRSRWVVPSGEMRPGVRSPEVWALKPER